jgi:hypothetical protein
MREGYDVAQVCPNGHTANDSFREFSDFNKEFCDKCGEKTITSCPKCNNPIRGAYHAQGVIGVFEYTPPAYCHNCGNAFPWTERKIQAAIELSVEEGNLNEEDSKVLEQSIKDIVRDIPQTQVAASRFKKIMTKVGSSTAGAVKDILVDIVSETAKKIIWPV